MTEEIIEITKEVNEILEACDLIKDEISTNSEFKDGVLTVRISLPEGFEKKHLSVVANSTGRIEVRGTRNTRVKKSGEKRTRNFSYVLTKPGIDFDATYASFQNEELTIASKINPIKENISKAISIS